MSEDKLGPPPVEPLSDLAWARVERGLWARMDGSGPIRTEAPKRRWGWIAVPVFAAAVLAVVIGTRGSSEQPAAPVATSESDVRVVAPATAPTTATFDDAHIELAPASAVVMRRDRPTTVLERGAAWFAVAPRVDRAPFIVLAGDATIRVIGTRFRVARSDERVDVEVDHGAVEVQYRGRLQILGAHQTWSSSEPERVVLLDTTTKTAPPIVKRVDPAPPSPGADKTDIGPTKPRPIGSSIDKSIDKLPVDKAGPDLDQTKFEQLGVLEKKDPEAAMTGYLEMSRRGSRWSANALYAAGRLAADRGDPRAATLLTVYLRRFPSGANVVDARALLARLPALKGVPR